MKISFNYPPNYEDIKKTFKLTGREVFTYGDVLFNPMRYSIPDHLVIHEEIHAKQQSYNDTGAKLWWELYIKDPKFRIDQEVEAYSAQYNFICAKVKDRNARYRNLHILSQDLSSEMYGDVISYTDAMRRIREGK